MADGTQLMSTAYTGKGRLKVQQQMYVFTYLMCDQDIRQKSNNASACAVHEAAC